MLSDSGPVHVNCVESREGTTKSPGAVAYVRTSVGMGLPSEAVGDYLVGLALELADSVAKFRAGRH